MAEAEPDPLETAVQLCFFIGDDLFQSFSDLQVVRTFLTRVRFIVMCFGSDLKEPGDPFGASLLILVD